jgi:hypothetical protein
MLLLDLLGAAAEKKLPPPLIEVRKSTGHVPPQ